jgi:hypothetical protein
LDEIFIHGFQESISCLPIARGIKLSPAISYNQGNRQIEREDILKTKLLLISLISLLLLPALFASCSKNEGSGVNNSEVQQADHEDGFSQGYSAGYQKGYADGKKGARDASIGSIPEGSTDFSAGYQEGFSGGYDEGYAKGASEMAGNGNDNQGSDDKAAVEAAMLTFVRNNSAPGLQFKIQNIVIHGNEAAGIAVCTSEKLENALVLMKKQAGTWQGVDLGTGIEPPSWYSY